MNILHRVIDVARLLISTADAFLISIFLPILVSSATISCLKLNESWCKLYEEYKLSKCKFGYTENFHTFQK